jgi:16S rRNA (cytidine1402-2'-O)-methyltransferase
MPFLTQAVMSEQRIEPNTTEPGVLYVVATPIGNLGDITTRAVEVLAHVALIAAEDTRRTLSLLAALGVSRPRMLALHDHNEAEASLAVRGTLAAGESAALVSDAGTPLLSDPGFALVRSCFEAGIPVRPVPGPSAFSAALSVCPIPAAGCVFAGFLPARPGARRSRLAELVEPGNPVLFFEAPHRLRACLLDLEALAPARRVFVAREMTKKFETYLCDAPAGLIETLDRREQWRGEFVCVLEGAMAVRAAGMAEQSRVMRILLRELPPAKAARVGAQLLKVRKGDLYRLAESLKGEPDADA